MNPGGKPVVVFTGSSGLIGCALCKELASDYQVVGFDRDGYPYPPIEAECICVDFSTEVSVQRARENTLDRCEPEARHAA